MDRLLFDIINQDLANPLLDLVLPWYREKLTWVPLYLLGAVLLVRSFGWRRTLYLLLCLGVVVTVADQLAASVLKPLVGRLRPCAEPGVADHARILVGCGGRFGFPSNHATNHFAVAVVLGLSWLRSPGQRWWLLGWAVTISLAQVYVGKHYPGDLLAGALLGSTVALVGVLLYRKLAGEWAIGGRNQT